MTRDLGIYQAPLSLSVGTLAIYIYLSLFLVVNPKRENTRKEFTQSNPFLFSVFLFSFLDGLGEIRGRTMHTEKQLLARSRDFFFFLFVFERLARTNGTDGFLNVCTC